MSQQLDQLRLFSLSDEELDALAATEIMGYYLSGDGETYFDGRSPVIDVAVWHPTAEGHEHQAKLVEIELLKLGYHVNKHSPRQGFPQWVVVFWRETKDKEPTLGYAFNEGRAIVLAALKAGELEMLAPQEEEK